MNTNNESGSGRLNGWRRTLVRWRAWMPSQGNVLFTVVVMSIVIGVQSADLLSTGARIAEGANASAKMAVMVKQVTSYEHTNVGPAHAQMDDLSINFSPGEVPPNAVILVDWHAAVYDNASTGCRAGAGARLDGVPGTFPDEASYQEVAISHTGLTVGEQTMSGSTAFHVLPGSHTLTLVLIAQDCGTRVFYVRSMRAVVVGK